MNDKNEVEKSLKRFLKKKVAYTDGLLVAFLITGAAIYASSTELASQAEMTKEDLLANIAAQKAEIQEMIDSNNERLKELDMDQDELIRKGDFYAKPIYGSTQIFFSYGYDHEGRGKDKTSKEWKSTIQDIKYKMSGYTTPKGINPYSKGEQILGYNESLTEVPEELLDKDINGNIPEDPVLVDSVSGETAIDLLKKGNGVYSNEKPFTDSIDLGANIQPLDPQLPTIGKTVDFTVASPALTTIPNPNPPTIAAPTAPGGVTISVTAPAAVDAIAITAPTAPTPNVPADKTISVTRPNTPSAFEPRSITPPTAPTTPVIVPPTIPTINFYSMSNGNGNNTAVDWVPGGAGSVAQIQNAIISRVAVLGGKFMVKREKIADAVLTAAGIPLGVAGYPLPDRSTPNNSFSYRYQDYKAYTNTGTATTHGIAQAAGAVVDLPDVLTNKYAFSLGNSYADSTGIQKIVYGGSTYNNGDFTVARETGVPNVNVYVAEFMHMDIHESTPIATIDGQVSDALTAAQAGSTMTAAETGKMSTAWTDAKTYMDASSTGGQAWYNSGDIILEGGKLTATNMYSHTGAAYRTGFAVNTGNFIVRPYSGASGLSDAENSVFLVSSEQEQDSQMITYNAGKIETWTQTTGAYAVNNAWFARGGNGSNYMLFALDAVVVNKGEIQMYGKNSIGVYGQHLTWEKPTGNQGSLTLDFEDAGTRKPIEMYGDQSVGLYVLDRFNSEYIKGNFHVNIGAAGLANQTITINAADTNGGLTITDYAGGNATPGTIDGSVGILSYRDIDLTSHGIVMYDKTKGCIGVAPLTGATTTETCLTVGGITSTHSVVGVTPTIKLGNGSIQMQGGIDNVGIYANDGFVESTGSIDITGGEGNTAAFANNSKTIKVNTITSGGAPKNAIAIIADNGTVTVTGGVNLLGLTVVDPATLTTTQDNSMAAYATNGGTISISQATTPATANIEVTGMQLTSGGYSGVGLMADGGTINAVHNYIKVKDGTGIANLNNGTINMDHSIIEMDGNGFAAYSSGGSVDLSNSDIILKGNTVGLEITVGTPNPINVSGTTIHVESVKAIGVNVKNTGILNLDLGDTQVTDLDSSISTALTGITFASTLPRYMQSAIEGGTLNINTPLDKASTAIDASSFYYRKFLSQALILNVKADITAELTSADATANFDGQVSALEMSSSSSAASRSQTQINIEPGVTVKAGRTDAGAGAVGAFINYGDLTNNGTIEIENSQKNSGGVGIYAVNGATVNNSSATGNITVYGENGVGILGTAYRETSTGIGIVGKEYGTALPNQGETAITNDGTVTMNGNKDVGIYLLNNSNDSRLAAGNNVLTKIVNNGTVTATGDSAAGIYAEGNGTMTETTVTNNGTIEVGKDGVAIFVDKAVDVQKVGTLKLGEEAIGVVLDKDSNISDTSTITASATTPTGNKMVVALKSDTPGTNDPAGQTLALDIDASTLDNGTAIYVWDRGSAATTVSSTGPLKIGNNGVGIYVENGHATNNGVITLDANGTQAVGMYTKNGTAINANQIIANKNGQIGMIAKSATGIIENQGTLDLNAQGTTGVFVDSGATATDSSLGNVNFNSIKSFGIAADNAHVILNGGTYSMNNAGENIYVYATNNSDVAINGVLTIDGVAQADPAKSVGIYLNGTNVINNGASVTAQNGAMGVYANGANTLTGGTFAADGDKSVGVYFSNGGTLDGNTITSGAVSGNSVGVYTAAGVVNIANPLTLNVGVSGALGTGMYFANGSSAQGAAIDITNLSSTDVNVGAYYTGGTATHGTDINITPASTQVVALYADGTSAVVTNTGTITDNSAGSVGTMVGGGAKLTNAGTINANGTSSVGMYVDNGAGKNSGTINTGTGIGALVVGSGGTFDGTGGTINVTGAGAAIGLNGTGPGQVTNSGTLNLSNGSIGVYAYNNAVADLPVTLQGTGGTGIYAEAGSVVTGNVDASTSIDTVGVFLEDATATLNGATVTAGTAGANTSIGLFLGGTSQTHTLSSGTINAPSANTVGIYVPTTNTLSFGPATVNVGANALGIYAERAGAQIDTNGGNLNIDAAGIGIYVKNGAVANVGTAGAINVVFNGAGGVLAFNDGGTINLGSSINITSGSGTLAATKDGSLSNSGTVNINAGTVGLLGVYSATGTGTIENLASGIMNVDAGGVGMAATGVAGATPTVRNDGIINANGASAVGMYGDVGTLNNTLGTINADNGAIGMYIKDNATISDLGTINVTGGVGYVSEGIASAPTGNLTLNNGTAAQYSIGGYYLNVNGTIASLPVIASQGNYTIGTVIENGNNSVTPIISVPGTGTDQVGLMTKNTTTSITGVTTSGDSNIGVFGENSTITSSGSITAGNSVYSADKSASSIGIYMNGGTLNAGGQTVSAGDNSIGVFGKNANATTGDVTAANTAVGVYVEGTGTENITVTGNVTAGSGSLGVYGKDTNVSVTGNLNVAEDLAVGIVSTGTGDITYSGNSTVAPKVNSASIAIYKGNGQGTVNTSGTFDIGKAGYALYVDNKAGTGTVNANNTSAITLNESSVGIYAGGNAVLNNTGNITVGSTDLGGDTTPDHSDLPKHLNSVGIYAEAGAKATNATGTTIIVDQEHSVGAYVTGTGTLFTNDGNINVDNGGVGVLVNNDAQVINNGNITLGYGLASCGTESVGIGAYTGAKVTNNGTITVGEGTGAYIAQSAELVNNGTIIVDNGVGVAGDGTYTNTGITVVGSGTADGGSSKPDPLQNGAIQISDGTVIVNNQYVHANGVLETQGNLLLDGATVILNKNNNMEFKANAIGGSITLDPSFAQVMDNGYAATITGVTLSSTAGGNLSITTSPLFMAAFNKKGTEIAIAKQPYAYMVTGSQFDNLYNGIDSLLALDQEGKGNDSQVLKGLNAHLENIYQSSGKEAFESEIDRTLAEMRGDIYATIKGRMNRVENAFDNSFDELMNSYNFSRNTGKYSLIYNHGKYKDKTLGIDDYKYGTTGLLYMHEYEGRNYASKWGYTLGFAVSRFDFDDSPTFDDKSKEDVYSLRAGLHNVHSFGEDDRTRLVSKLEIGYNRHEAERTIELDQKYKNKAGYNTWTISLDNKLEKTLYRTVSSGVELYGGVNLEYAKLNNFTEDSKGNSGLELKIKNKDYFSVEGAIGVKGHKRAYIGKKISAKITGDIAYVHEFADNYGRTKAKVAGGTEGYYSLIKPDEEKGKVRGRIGLTLEKADHYGVTFDIEVRKGNNKKGADVRYGVRFNYKFGGGR